MFALPRLLSYHGRVGRHYTPHDNAPRHRNQPSASCSVVSRSFAGVFGNFPHFTVTISSARSCLERCTNQMNFLSWGRYSPLRSAPLRSRHRSASGAPRSESHPLVLSKHSMAYTRYLFAWVMRAPSYTRKEKGTTARAKNPTNACCLHSALRSSSHGRWHVSIIR